jgi:uncharacterized secreted protein with C-terminal beta-propeller domain
MRHPALLPLLALGTLAACSSSTNSLPPPTPVAGQVALTKFTDCNGLKQSIEDTVVLEMRSQLEMARQGYFWPMGLAGGGPVPANASNASGPSAYTTTNAQVAGVHEADFVQNDGTRIFVLSGDMLYLSSSWPPQSLALQSKLKIEGWPREMFFDAARSLVVVFSSVYSPRPLDGDVPICVDVEWSCGYFSDDVTKVTTVDVTNLASPNVVAELYLPGSYLTSRLINDSVRLVLNDALPYPQPLRFWPDLPPAATTDQRNAAFAQLEQANEAIIRGYSLDDWLRRPSYKAADGTTVPLGYNCTDFARSNGPTRMGIVTIATLTLDGKGLTSRTSVLEQAGLVYASLSTLYIASPHWWWWPAPGQDDATYVHAFDTTQPDSVAYLGSGVVAGNPRDQYSFDEWNGHLRVASQLGHRVEDATSGPWGRLVPSSQISVLALQNGRLATTGTSEQVGGGESLYASRFLSGRGFLVTARQVDPLITFDLSDPTHPHKVAELSVPGFSSYLHPIDDTHLLAIGALTAPNDSGSQLQLTLYDVSDLANPMVTSTALVGQGWAYSEALWDPKAFTWFPEKKLLALPFVDWQPSSNWTGFVSDLRLFTVDTTAGITPVGHLSMADVYETANDDSWTYYWTPLVRRSVLADNAVYAISDAGIRSALVPNLPSWLATVRFTPLAP